MYSVVIMAFVQLITVVCMTLISCHVVSASMECQKCTNLESSSSGGIFGNLIHSNTDPECKTGTYSETTECGDSDGCYYMDFSATFESILGSISISGQERGCAPSGAYSTGCVDVDPNSQTIIKELSALAGAPVSIDGKYCQCDTPLCDASCKGPFSFGDFCVQWWLAGAVGGATLLILIGLVSCCCCCCGCCRSSPHGRHVPVQQYGIITTTVPVVPVQGAAGHNEFTNPGYTSDPNAMPPNKVY